MNTSNNNSNNEGFNYLATKGEPENTIPYSPPSNDTSSDANIPFLADKELSQTFDFCVPDISSVKVFLAIYDINTRATVPFLRYIVETGETATFPSFQFACSTTEDNTEHFKTEAVLFLMQVLMTTGSLLPDNLYENTFRGMVFNAEHKCVIAVFNYINVNVNNDKPQPSTHTWAIVDELVFERRVWNLPVDPAISDTMRQNSLLWTLSSPDFQPPFSLYMVKETDESIIGTEVSPNSDAPSLFQHGDTIDTYKYADEYGDMYIFCAKPLLDDGTGSERKYARYAVFTYGAKYLLEDQYHHAYLQQEPTLKEEKGEESEEKGEEIEGADVIYFVEDRLTKTPTQLWGIKESSRFTRL